MRKRPDLWQHRRQRNFVECGGAARHFETWAATWLWATRGVDPIFRNVGGNMGLCDARGRPRVSQRVLQRSVVERGRQRSFGECEGATRPFANWATTWLCAVRRGDPTFRNLGYNIVFLWNARGLRVLSQNRRQRVSVVCEGMTRPFAL